MFIISHYCQRNLDLAQITYINLIHILPPEVQRLRLALFNRIQMSENISSLTPDDKTDPFSMISGLTNLRQCSFLPFQKSIQWPVELN